MVITLQYIDKFSFCVKIYCLNGLKLPLNSWSAESEFPRNRRGLSGHNKVREIFFLNLDLTV
jgi:hypothetical protein